MPCKAHSGGQEGQIFFESFLFVHAFGCQENNYEGWGLVHGLHQVAFLGSPDLADRFLSGRCAIAMGYPSQFGDIQQGNLSPSRHCHNLVSANRNCKAKV